MLKQALGPADDVRRMEQAPARQSLFGAGGKAVKRELGARGGHRAVREIRIVGPHEEEAAHASALNGIA